MLSFTPQMSQVWVHTGLILDVYISFWYKANLFHEEVFGKLCKKNNKKKEE